MRMTKRSVLSLSTIMTVAALAACSDSPTAPSAPARIANAPSFAFAFNPASPPAPVLGQIIICKGGNIGGTFSLSTRIVTNNVDGAPAVSQLALANGFCEVAVTDNSGANSGKRTVITELAAADPANTTQALTACQIITQIEGQQTTTAGPCSTDPTSQRFINSFHGYVITYTNTFTPPPPPPPVCDFSTFGGFTLENNFNISYGGNAGKIEGGFAYGDLNFENHDTGDHIHVWNVTDYGHPASGPLSNFADSRFAIGLAEINGSGSHPVEFRFVDLGEPGTKDRVWLKVDGAVLIQEQVVQGGNVQLHDVCKKAPTDEKH